MISEGSCDTPDWSNYAENETLDHQINYILKCSPIENIFYGFKYFLIVFALFLFFLRWT